MDREHNDAPTDEEVAAAIAAVRALLRRRAGRNPRGAGSRWARAGRAEAVTAPPAAVGWATVERPR